MKMLVIGASFPSKSVHSEGVYLYNLMRFFRLKYELEIYIPAKLINSNQCRILELDEFNKIIKRPKFLNLGFISAFFKKYKIGPLYTLFRNISLYSHYRSITSSCPDDISLIYSHFIYPSGLSAYRISIRNNIPFFVALGESGTNSYNSELSAKIFSSAKGIIVVSNKIRNYLIYNIGINSSKILYSPNSADTDIFKPMDKHMCRERLGLSNLDKIVIFVGQFIERKGYNRVLKSVDILPYKVYCIFIGNGSFSSSSDNICFKGSVDNSALPYYYNAADFFILPTLGEGSCNAIAEAIACGLPVLSSNLSEIGEQVFESSSILVDPEDINEIARGIEQMYSKYNILKENALNQSQKNSLKIRAQTISDFILKQLE